MNVAVEELKTVKRFVVTLGEDLSITLRARSKKQEQAIIRVLNEVRDDLEYLTRHKRFKIERLCIFFIVRITYDLVKVKGLINYDFADDYVRNLLDFVTGHVRHLEELSEIASVCISPRDGEDIFELFAENECDLLRQLAKVARYIREHEKELLEQFDAVLKVVSDYVKALNKAITETNSEYLKHLKRMREVERKALERGDFEKVGNETLKNYFRDLFPRGCKLIVLDKSSRHRAVLFAEVDYDGYLYPDEQYVKRLTLVGEDDNGEEWRHIVIDYLSEADNPPRVSEVLRADYTVEWAMAKLFDVPIDVVEVARRQGDILFVKCTDVDAEAEEVADELEIRANHVLKSKGIKVLKHDLAPVFVEEGYVVEIPIRDEWLLVRLEAKGIVQHPSHRPIELEPGTYVVIPLPIPAD